MPRKTIKQQLLEDLNRSTSFPEINRIPMTDSHALIRNIASNLASNRQSRKLAS